MAEHIRTNTNNKQLKRSKAKITKTRGTNNATITVTIKKAIRPKKRGTNDATITITIKNK